MYDLIPANLEVSVSSHQFAYAQKRRSTRLDQAIRIEVQGVGALREPYQEEVSTLSVSCHGCSYQSKHEVLQGEFVILDVKPPDQGSLGYSGRARVKWVQKLEVKDRSFRVAVELENAGNIWGIAAPPEDWFPPQLSHAAGPQRELRVVPYKEQQLEPTPEGRSGQVSIERSDTNAPCMPSLAQLMVGIGDQIQIMASEAATAALIKEKNRVLDEFRGQLRQEAVKTVQAVITASKEDISRRALKELSEAHEAGVRANYQQWAKTIEQDLNGARQHMMAQGKDVSQRIDGMAVSTIERVQRSMETARSEAADRFVSRLRDQVAPLLAETKGALEALAASEIRFKKETQAIGAGLEAQLEKIAHVSIAKAQDELDKASIVAATMTNESLVKLSQSYEKAARENMELLLASIGTSMNKVLEQRTAEISHEFSTALQSYAQNYLEFIGKSIADVPRKLVGEKNVNPAPNPRK
jgi:hypothetical protein